MSADGIYAILRNVPAGFEPAIISGLSPAPWLDVVRLKVDRVPIHTGIGTSLAIQPSTKATPIYPNFIQLGGKQWFRQKSF
jgi:hypothetical protein